MNQIERVESELRDLCDRTDKSLANYESAVAKIGPAFEAYFRAHNEFARAMIARITAPESE